MKKKGLWKMVSLLLTTTMMLQPVGVYAVETAGDDACAETVYTVTMQQSEQGTINDRNQEHVRTFNEIGTDGISCSVSEYAEGESVILEVFPKEGYAFSVAEVKDDMQQSVSYTYDDVAGTLVFTMPDASVTVCPAFEEKDGIQDEEMQDDSACFSGEESATDEGTEESESEDEMTLQATEDGKATVTPTGGSVTLCEYLGISADDVVEWMESHEKDGYYIGTPYPVLKIGMDWRTPNGEAKGGVGPTYQSAENKGVGMQCTGFVWNVLANVKLKSGLKVGNDIPHLATTYAGTYPGGWTKAMNEQNLLYYEFKTKQEMLDSGILEKGDVIISYDLSTGGVGSISNNHHFGFFWGDTSGEDKYWHSGPMKDCNLTTEINGISTINRKTEKVIWRVVKLGKREADEILIRTTVSDATLGGTAKDQNGIAYGMSTGLPIVNDRVEISGLKVGKTYRVVGKLYDRTAGQFVKDANDNEVSVSQSFIAQDCATVRNMTFDLSVLSVDQEETLPIAGHQLVVYEYLYRVSVTQESEKQIAKHTDVNDKGQTIVFPAISTSLKDDETGQSVAPAKEKASVTDWVELHNLRVGSWYTVSGTLMDQQTGKPLLNAKGEKIQSTVRFEAKHSEYSAASFAAGTGSKPLELNFAFDASALAGHTMVAFEDLYYDKTLVAVHHDIEDESQTVYVPEIGTRLTDTHSGAKLTFAGEQIFVTDAVAYHNLPLRDPVTGDAYVYTLTGELYQKSTGEKLNADMLIEGADGKLQKVDGIDVTPQSQPGDAMSGDGVVEVTFGLDASELSGEDIVAFETLALNGKLVAEHRDLEDESQTVQIPKIGTSASNRKDGEHFLEFGEQVEVVDHVTYSNLMPGLIYVVKGTVMDKKTGEPLLVDGEPVTAETEFAPETSDGMTEVIFTMDTTEIPEGDELVIYEELYAEGALVAEHKDLKDREQTIMMPFRIRIRKVDPDGGYVKGASLALYELQEMDQEQLEQLTEQEWSHTDDPLHNKEQAVLLKEGIWSTEEEDLVSDSIKVSSGDKQYVYALKEEQAPDGYATADTIFFKVTAESVEDGYEAAIRYYVDGMWMSWEEWHQDTSSVLQKLTAVFQNQSNESSVVSMEDDTIKLQISKEDIATGKELPGAKLELYNAKNERIEQWVSGTEPHYIEMLPVGTYSLREMTAPEGYEKAEEIVFEIVDTAEVQQVIMLDAPSDKVIPPSDEQKPGVTASQPTEKHVKTGDDSPLIPLCLCIAAATMTIVFVCRKRRGLL